MPLPKIVTPSYELTLPSNGKKIKYRPFLVKEEKILILAIEGGDMKDITTAIKDVLSNCILSKGIKIDDLPTFDIVASCMEMVFTDEEAWEAKDCTREELVGFVEQLNSTQFREIENFFNTMPKLSHDIEVENPQTKVKSTVKLEGLANFFA